MHSVYTISDLEKPTADKVNLSSVFSEEMNNDLVWQVVNSIRYQRITTKNTKSRSDVSGGGKKPWRQKGTGRARAGTTRGPVWVGGGVTFAHESRVCSHKINKKMYRKAITVILSELKNQNKIVILDELKLENHKTKELASKIQTWIDLRKVLVLTDSIDPNFLMASRNLHQIYYGLWQSTICPDLLCDSNLLVVTKKALIEIEEWLK